VRAMPVPRDGPPAPARAHPHPAATRAVAAMVAATRRALAHSRSRASLPTVVATTALQHSRARRALPAARLPALADARPDREPQPVPDMAPDSSLAQVGLAHGPGPVPRPDIRHSGATDS